MLSSLTKRRWHILALMLLTLAMVLPGLSSLPVIDRDEARFAQASVQMADTNDLLNIRFQDEARNKKPAGAYWAQTAMIKTFARDGEQRLWAQRVPSALAALISILALYWGGLRMVGRQASFVAGALLATSLIFVFEGHIAKTDALLCASTTVIFACLGRLRHGAVGKREIWGFWIALGLSIMIKGPIGPILALLSLLSLWVWKRDLSWARPLINWGAILAFILIWVPWAIAMYVVTDGAFYAESLGKDFGGKITSGQEKHGLWPGAHSAFIWAGLWPGCLFLLPGFAYVISTLKSGQDTPITRSMQLIICWAVPFWILIEVMPTKLPHYGLPVIPALCLAMGTAVLAMKEAGGFRKTRVFGGFLFLISTGGIVTALILAQLFYGDTDALLGTYLIGGITAVVAIAATFALWGRKIRLSLGAALVSALICSAGAYIHILPNLTKFMTAERVLAELERFAPGTPSDAIHSPHFTEPSLVYNLGQGIDVKDRKIDLSDGSLVILNARRENASALSIKLSKTAKKRGRCLESSNPINGMNYSNGTPLSLVILREAPC